MKILTVVGARPQFIKAAVVSHEIERRSGLEERLVHTGQHYDYGMSEVFFDELDIPRPAINLGISGGSHAEMTARMLVALEKTMIEEQPDIVLLYGDTNSTLAGALSAAKLHLPIAHVEAGARTHSRENPEEVNRVCTDHVSTLLLVSTLGSMDNLASEGLSGLAQFVGDPMYDAFLQYSKIGRKPNLLGISDSSLLTMPSEFYYLTCHREENTHDTAALGEILEAMNSLDAPVIYPVHPRNVASVKRMLRYKPYRNIMFVQPLGYLESLYLVNNAKQVVTDSGGLQREAFFAEVKCTTIFNYVTCPETMINNRNILAKPDSKSILAAMNTPQQAVGSCKPFGDGHSAIKIVDALVNHNEVL